MRTSRFGLRTCAVITATSLSLGALAPVATAQETQVVDQAQYSAPTNVGSSVNNTFNSSGSPFADFFGLFELIEQLLKLFGINVGSSSAPVAPETPAPEEPASGPKNIIYMIGDGMGYNHVAATNLYETGQSRYLVESDEDGSNPVQLPGDPVQVFEHFNLLSLATYQAGNSYEADRAWTDHNYINESYTDSAAAGTAMATGVKTANGMLGVDAAGTVLENASERAKEQGKAAGVVSSVPFSHATPAAWAAHNQSRNDYHGIASEMIDGDLDVIMGAGHPMYDNTNRPLAKANYRYISAEDYWEVSSGATDWTYVESQDEFQALADGVVEGDTQYFGLAPVASTLQQGRAGTSAAPYDVPMNNVVDLATMTTGALNVLGQYDDGFHLMVEAGAIDWTGHANDIYRNIEETQSFNAAIEAAVAWVEENSSWDETLLIVTADHETGYLSGADEDPNWNAMFGNVGEVPNVGWYSGNHTNQLVPFFFKGAGSEDIYARIDGTDPVRGDYIDNTLVADLTLNTWWTRD